MNDAVHSHRNLVMGTLAAQAALGVQAAAQVLYETGGKEVLAASTQAGLRKTLAGGAVNTVATLAPQLLVEGTQEATAFLGPKVARELVGATGKVVLAETARAASAQVLRGALRAGGVGLLLDGAFGAITGVRAVRKGTMTRREACVHTATEAGTGAVSTVAGVALAAGVIALTGALAAPTVAAIGAGGALAAKLGLGRLFQRTAAPADTVETTASETA